MSKLNRQIAIALTRYRSHGSLNFQKKLRKKAADPFRTIMGD